MGLAAQGQVVSSPASSGRRKYLADSSNISNQRIGRHSTLRFSRNLFQTCTREEHEKVYGDVNFDCKFEFITDAITMAEIFGEWNPDLDNFPQSKRSIMYTVFNPNEALFDHSSAWSSPQSRVVFRSSTLCLRWRG